MTHIHFIGIGGSGLSAIARLMLESGHTVSGSDRVLSPLADDLKSAGATVHIGHHADHISGADWVVRSSAVEDNNPEVLAAKNSGIPVYKRSDFIGKLMAGRNGIAVAGTHGKTTTTAMLAWTLSAAGKDPSFIVGGVMNNLGVNARAGSGPDFVIEADEYDRMFLGLRPQVAVVTNVEHDHPDCYPTANDFRQAFVDFISLLPSDGTLVACAQDQGAVDIATVAGNLGRRVVYYGFEKDISLRGAWVLAQNVEPNKKGGFNFNASVKGQSLPVALQVPGKHNVLNALAVLAVADLIGLPLEAAASHLGEFRGTGRRFELRGEAQDILVIDDYAHHPTEIRATLSAARARFPDRRIWAVWQPHTYSRTKVLFDEFTRAFEDADEVIVTAIYAAREPAQSFSSEQVVADMQHPSARYIASLEAVSNYLLSNLRSGDALLVLSAGDADQVSSQVLSHFQNRENQNERQNA